MNKKFKMQYDISLHLYRIQALRDIRGSKFIEKGSFGGFIQYEENLNADDESWIDSDTCVFNDSVITDNSYIEHSIINNSKIRNSRLTNTKVLNSQIYNSTVDKTSIKMSSTIDQSVVRNSTISNSSIDDSQISVGSSIYNSALTTTDISNTRIIRSTLTDTTISNSKIESSATSGMSGKSVGMFNCVVKSSEVINTTFSECTLNGSYVKDCSSVVNTKVCNSRIESSYISNTFIYDSTLKSINANVYKIVGITAKSAVIALSIPTDRGMCYFNNRYECINNLEYSDVVRNYIEMLKNGGYNFLS